MSVARPLVRAGLRPLLGLPPALRQSIYSSHQEQNNAATATAGRGAARAGTAARAGGPGGVRHFSYSAIAGTVDVASLFALAPASAMHLLHTIGLPWWAVFPASALLVRSVVVYPLFQKKLRERQVQRISVQPLLEARLGLERRRMAKRHEPRVVERARMLYKRLLINSFLGRAIFGQPSVSLVRGASFFTLMAVSDGIRRLSGHKEGLLSLLLSPSGWFFASSSQPPKPDEISTTTTTTTADSSLDTVTTPTPNIALDSPWFEPGLLTDGIPSWCLDLTASDPTLILPFVFSASFFLNIYLSPRISGLAAAAAATTENGTAPKATNQQRLMMSVAIFSIVPALRMPAALLLYFIANIWISALQTRWLSYTMPVRPVPTACRRPVRTEPMAELGDDSSFTSSPPSFSSASASLRRQGRA